MLAPLLRRHRLAQGRLHAVGEVPRPVLQDRGAQPHLLRICGRREHLAEVSRGVVQSGGGGYHALLHGGVCVPDDGEEGGVDYVCHADPGGHRRYHRQRGEFSLFPLREKLDPSR